MVFHTVLKKFLTASLILTVLLFSAGAQAAASHELAASGPVKGRVGWIQKRGDAELDENGRRTGYVFELLDAIAQKGNVQFEYVQAADRDELLDLLAEGAVDLTVTNGIDQYGDAVSLLPLSVGTSVKMLCARSGDDRFCADDFAAFNRMTLAMPDSPILQATVEAYEASRRFSTGKCWYRTSHDARIALLVGNADLALLDNYEDLGGLVVLSQFGLSDRSIAVRSACEELKAAVGRGEEALFLADPFFLHTLYTKHFASAEGPVLAYSKDELSFLWNAPTVDVYLRTDLTMFSKEKNGVFFGYIPYLLNKLTEATGLRFNLIGFDNTEELVQAFKSAKSKNSLCVLPVEPGYLDDESFRFSNPITSYTVQLLTRKDMEKHVSSVAYTGNHHFKAFVANTGFQGIEYENDRKCLDAVIRGEVDAAMIENYVVQQLMNRRKYRDSLSILYDPVINSSIAFASSSASDGTLLGILNKTCGNFPQSQLWDYVRVTTPLEYFGKDSFAEMLADNWQIVFLFFLLFSATLIIIFLQHRFNMQLEASNRNKDVFLADMSHDFRTPLTAISGFAYLGKTENDPRYYPEIITSVAYMQELVNDILNIRQYSEGKSLELQPEPLIAGTLYDSILSVMHGRASSKKIQINFDTDISYPYIVVDPMRVRQVFVNIISNAIKYSSKGSTVEVKVEDYVQSHVVRVRATITDHGEGMSRDFLKQRIFHPFEREKNAYSAKEGGSGLGLAITKIIMDRLGGTISVESELGKGSTFTLDFPVETITKEEYERKHKDDGSSLKSKEFDFTGCHVLLCEDNEINTFIISNILQKKGFIVDCAENGKIGLETFRNSAIGYYQLLLMDIRMPEMDGIEATKAIRALNRSDAQIVPIIALSANAFEEDKMKSAQAGMNAHLAKPIDVDTLFRSIDQLLNAF